ncbi:P-II family nitrogen regulator [Parvibium lacunae]|uniref:P-II family nitrogen regulator n=2 Tax=Parvibium lacunae TaxID=1888893 RepID=A0A368L272_9BURK|nr:P-II family nitrogen regulator [Parvibium lacunae]
MKEIRAIIRPTRLPHVQAALRGITNYPALVVGKVEGFTAPPSIGPRNLKEELTDFVPKVLVSILAPTEAADAIVQAIMQHGRTGKIGDGLVWITPVDQAWRIRDGAPAETMNTADKVTD